MKTADILVVDDDAAIRTVVAAALKRAGHRVRTAETLAQAKTQFAKTPDLLVTDVVLPDGDGLEMVSRIVRDHPGLPIIVLSAKNTLSTAVRATEAGAFDYLPKPFDLDTLTAAIASALERNPAANAGDEGAPDEALPLIGRSPAMQDVYRTIARVVSTDLTVLVFGESGTGKELVAQAIHDLGNRRDAPFVALNMAAIPRELIEAELFGHERGAFTGAQARAAGKFEQASGGTLFLDEIGDMPMDAQTRLLRVLQSGEFISVGGSRTIRADVRIVAATNKDLSRLVAENRFREDLFYRLNVVPITMPPLRERPQDVPLLARHFLDRGAEQGLPRKRLADSAIELLKNYSWPGNVRELENLMRRIAVLGRDDVIADEEIRAMLGEGSDLPAPASREGGLAESIRARLKQMALAQPALLEDGSLYDRIIAEVEKPLIEVVLERTNGNQLRAAKALGINRNTLRKKLDMLKIDAGTRSKGAD
ncbi:nitrogen regulation protein NR(I) [Stakelama sp. CBK3Z-3]|uniref:DNA-binding transcriptional regulator NtrC n=1 Tax=Stakelama flava TaxID=2860338 RepID=A0ABS6XMC1_9SPHN|nr:nitrogen regulation protein NR(I) [Stakelama flava]MBW4330943.1 nitrogen regulation protein NR(I) [Stakelama flava]